MVSRSNSLPLFPEAPPAQAGGVPPRTPHNLSPAPPESQLLWLCACLFELPLQVFAQPEDSRTAFAVSEGEGGQQRVLCCNSPARDLGIRPGQSLNSALALAPTLLLRPRQPGLERAAMQRLMHWSGQFTSHVHGEGDHLLLEVRGSLRLFGGLAALRARVEEGLMGLGYTACVAAAPTPLASLWLARAGRTHEVLTTGRLPASLGCLPLSVTGWPVRVRKSLRDLGVRQLRDCLRLPRDGFSRRIGETCLADLDRALGRRPDPRPAWRPPERYRGRLELPMPVAGHGALLHALERLVRELAGYLRARQAAVRRLDIGLEHQEGVPTRCTLHLLQEERDPEHFLELMGERLERLSLPAPVAALTLSSDRLRVLVRGPESLFERRERHSSSPATALALVERLRARLGSEAVHGLCLVPEHRPESAWRVSEPGQDSFVPVDKKRPFWLLDEPRPLALRAGCPWLDGPLTLESAPERIETGWWDGKDVARDYYRARSHDGVCLWVFRERRGRRAWFLHGVFA